MKKLLCFLLALCILTISVCVLTSFSPTRYLAYKRLERYVWEHGQTQGGTANRAYVEGAYHLTSGMYDTVHVIVTEKDLTFQVRLGDRLDACFEMTLQKGKNVHLVSHGYENDTEYEKATLWINGAKFDPAEHTDSFYDHWPDCYTRYDKEPLLEIGTHILLTGMSRLLEDLDMGVTMRSLGFRYY